MVKMATDDAGLERMARAIHRATPVVDLHADPLLWSRLAGYDLLRRHENRVPRSPYWAHSDVPRWEEAGVRVVLTGVVTLPFRPGARGCFRQAMTTLSLAHGFAERSDKRFEVIRGAADLAAAAEGGFVGALPALEGCHALEGSIDKLDRLLDGGLRSVGLAHFCGNAAVACAYGPGGDRGPLSRPSAAARGLTEFGREMIDRATGRGAVIDLAHTSRSGFLQAAKIARTPPFVSHTGIAGATPHWRNIDDEQVRAVVERGGIVGVIFAGRFLGGSRLADVVRHIDYLVQNFGDACVALGSDFDGMIVPVKELPDVTHLWKLTAALLAKGYDEQRIRRILGLNALRYLAANLGVP